MPRLLFNRGPEHQPIHWTMRGPDGWTILRRVIGGLVLCVLILPLTIGLAALSGVGHRWVDILAQFPAPMLALTVILVALSAVLRLRVAALAGLVVLVVLAAALWPQVMADRGRPKAGAPVVTLYSANLLSTNTETDAIVASIKAANPDILVLIEVPLSVSEHTGELLPQYPYRLGSPWPGFGAGTTGNVILSRYPLTPGAIRAPGLSYALATVDTPLGKVNVVGMHMTRPWPYQFQWGQLSQAMALKILVGKLQGPVIVAGDFNSVSSARVGRQIQTDIGLKANPGWPGSWPSNVPAAFAFTIDQVYRTPDLAVIDRRIGKPTGSDHRPIITRLTLAEPQPAS
jgi:endonuclease/exonuclease/phosphatase (EEP) superfamily protein YafD